jgi:hypothetical protein
MANIAYPKNDPKYLWVDPTDEKSGDGTFNRPYGRITTALSKAKPGNIVVLKTGMYPGDLTVQTSGSMELPLRIVGDHDAEVVISGGCWFFYDVSDIIVSGLLFHDAPRGGVAIIGLCQRNRFDNLQFKNCGHAIDASSTMFFGGAGASCNIIEHCSFERLQVPAAQHKKKPDAMAVGLMISEGDNHEGKPITNHVVRKNKFLNYDYGILIGTEDATMGQYGHLVAYNTIENCNTEGIMVKCGDTRVKGNLVLRCPGNSISVVTGEGSMIEDNRVIDCGCGIRVAGKGHTVVNNCIVRSGREAIRVMEKNGHDGSVTQNVLIEQNTCAGWSEKNAEQDPGISMESGTSVVVKRNLFLGNSDPYRIKGKATGKSGHLISDNLSSATCSEQKGVNREKIEITLACQDNFDNESGYGARGWMCRPEAFDPDPELPEQTECAYDGDTDLSQNPDADDEPEFSMDRAPVLEKFLFFNVEEYPDFHSSPHQGEDPDCTYDDN